LRSRFLQFLQLLASNGLDSFGYPVSTQGGVIRDGWEGEADSQSRASSARERGNGGRNALPPSDADATIPLPHLTLCASYLLVKLCESGIFSTYQSDLLMKLLNTLLFAVYDVSFEDGSTHGTGPKCKRTPFYTRFKHLQMAFQDVEKYRVGTENRSAAAQQLHTCTCGVSCA
jgi:hypothetical protein